MGPIFTNFHFHILFSFPRTDKYKTKRSVGFRSLVEHSGLTLGSLSLTCDMM